MEAAPRPKGQGVDDEWRRHPALRGRVLMMGISKELMAPGAMTLPGGKLWNLSNNVVVSFCASRQRASSRRKKVEVEHARA